MTIGEAFRRFQESHRQTKYFVFMFALYMIALVWTTFQAYARLEYSRSDTSKPIIIQTSDNSP